MVLPRDRLAGQPFYADFMGRKQTKSGCGVFLKYCPRSLLIIIEGLIHFSGDVLIFMGGGSVIKRTFNHYRRLFNH